MRRVRPRNPATTRRLILTPPRPGRPRPPICWRIRSWRPRRRPAKESSELPMMILIEAGLTVFDGVLVIIFAVLWRTNPDLLLFLLEGRAGITLILGSAPIILAAVISKRNEKKRHGDARFGVGPRRPHCRHADVFDDAGDPSAGNDPLDTSTGVVRASRA